MGLKTAIGIYEEAKSLIGLDYEEAVLAVVPQIENADWAVKIRRAGNGRCGGIDKCDLNAFGLGLLQFERRAHLSVFAALVGGERVKFRGLFCGDLAMAFEGLICFILFAGAHQ